MVVEIEQVFHNYFASQGLATEPTAFDGRSDYGPFIAVGIPAGGLFSGAEGVKTAEEAAVYGGTAGEPYDPCYHQACDDITNLNVKAFTNTGTILADEGAATITGQTSLANSGTIDLQDDAVGDVLTMSRLCPTRSTAVRATATPTPPTSRSLRSLKGRTSGHSIANVNRLRARTLQAGVNVWSGPSRRHHATAADGDRGGLEGRRRSRTPLPKAAPSAATPGVTLRSAAWDGDH